MNLFKRYDNCNTVTSSISFADEYTIHKPEKYSGHSSSSRAT